MQPSTNPEPVVLAHPWVLHNQTIIRNTKTNYPQRLLAVEQVARELIRAATENLPTEKNMVDTPTAKNTWQPSIELYHTITMVHVMRAGIGFQSAVTNLRQAGFPITQEIYLEAKRNEDTLNPDVLACKLPEEIDAAHVIFGEPMCATGGSTASALKLVLERATERVQQVSCLHFFATDEGLSCVANQHPGVTQICAAIDPELNDKGYIVPGCGDFGNLVTGVIPFEED